MYHFTLFLTIESQTFLPTSAKIISTIIPKRGSSEKWCSKADGRGNDFVTRREEPSPKIDDFAGTRVLALYEETRGLSADWSSANFW